MRAPSILAQCWPGLLPQERGGHDISTISERVSQQLSSPAVELQPSKFTQPSKYVGENIDMQGLNILKGRLSVSDIISISYSEISSKPEGSLKSWESSIDLVNVLKNEIRDGQLSFRGKQVLELSCGNGLPGIFACLKGASTMHFQDLNAETVRCKTIPNVIANLEEARDKMSRQLDGPVTPSRHGITTDVHFYAGDYEKLHTVLSVVRRDGFEMTSGMSVSYSEEDLTDVCSSQDGSVLGIESSSRRSKKLSGSRAWERAIEADPEEGGYDVILMTEIPYSTTNLKKLYALIKKDMQCLRPPYGVLYLGTKKNHLCDGGAKQLRSLLDEEGIFGAHIIMETTDREMWKFFLK